MSAIEDLVGARLSVGEHAEVLPDLERLVREHPLRERFWAHLMLARYRSGRQAEALDAFRQAQELLADELGIDPSQELQELQRRMLQQDPTLQLTGKPLRGYRLLERVGEGAFGVVWRALDPELGREVGVKQIHPRLVRRPELRPTLRAGGADDRAARASARRPALRLLARRERRVPRDALDARREPRGRPRCGSKPDPEHAAEDRRSAGGGAVGRAPRPTRCTAT